jgi:hypothetical protein
MCNADESRLPLHLRLTEPLELDQLPLHVALLTMELAEVRTRLTMLADSMGTLATVMRLPEGGLFVNERVASSDE